MIDGQTRPCDLIEKILKIRRGRAILKSIPRLEQVDKEISPHMLENLQTDHIPDLIPCAQPGGRKRVCLNFIITFLSPHFRKAMAYP